MQSCKFRPPYTPRPPTTLAQRKALLQQAMESPKDQGLSPGPREFVMAKSSPEETTPARLERRRKLMEMAKASFPDGVPDPYTLIDSFSKDHLPFICVTVKMYS